MLKQSTASESSALLIIDQQKGIDEPRLGPRNNSTAEKHMLRLLTYWREKRLPLVHIKHRSTDPDSVFWPEQGGFEFKEEFKPQEHEFVLEKSMPCAFTPTGLNQYLREKNVDSVLVVGVATNNSVEATVRTAACLGYSVTVIEDACFTFAKKDYAGADRSAEEVHAMSLANLHNEYAHVISIASFFDASV